VRRIVVYSQIIQLFEIIEYQPIEKMIQILSIHLLVKIMKASIASFIITRKKQEKTESNCISIMK
jgi:hypothetical protein